LKGRSSTELRIGEDGSFTLVSRLDAFPRGECANGSSIEKRQLHDAIDLYCKIAQGLKPS